MGDSSGASNIAKLMAKPRVHFGSLEEQESAKRFKHDETSQQAAIISAASSTGGGIDLDALAELADRDTGAGSLQGNQQVLAEFDRRKRAREIAVPTDDGRVRQRLREEAESESESEEEEDEEFFTPGSQALLEARQWITTYSLPRAKRRLEKQQLETQIPLTQMKVGRRELSQKLKEYTGWSSQVADERPVSQCAFSPDSKLLVTGSWSGGCKVWSVPDCKLVTTLAGHADRVGGVAFHPESTLSLDKSVANFATSGAEGSVKLWSLDSASPLATMEGHVGRVARIGYHPSGRGLDAIGRLWDLRTGRSAMALQGHIKDIIGLDWSPNGYHLASASADNSVKIWDIRALRNIYTISAHQSLVSDVKFAKGRSPMATNDSSYEASSIYGTYLTTVGYDGCVKMWSADDYRLMKSLEGHEGKVMGVDISKDGRFIASTGFDRTFKLWADENLVV
ncbi:hypothetical protein [Absidia glauca]|uniref:Uncharacterized protein n=1 Tax=Absidia glauca TaxID=4829 RepID=A0A163MUV8_ABSGL|nr:hypothetical protein [Absidia glauca]